ncbi:hypothetical protein EVJ58_g4437 [Rhodofomes roseus]|uniref:Uncharacterized protein n=1 Tax=Rhodofomes roseus TaxID=34475 RepID=A0A4Y9YKS8_9APHY|nr:hypothetical protein EVJ58_g4437 [Rhodofomes roseus]
MWLAVMVAPALSATEAAATSLFPHHAAFAALLLLSLGYGARGATTPVNRTIDDYLGDSATGARPVFSPGWNYGPTCPGCYVQPDIALTFDRSWHDTTVSVYSVTTNISIEFTGTALWVYGIVPNYVRNANTLVNVSFALDGAPAGNYTHQPSSSNEFFYNVTLFSTTALENVAHTLVMTPQGTAEASYLAFDWAEYTYEEEVVSSSTVQSAATSSAVLTPTIASSLSNAMSPPQSASTLQAASPTGSSSMPSQTPASQSTENANTTPKHNPPVAAIAGGVIGGLCGLALLAILFYLCQRASRRGSTTGRADADGDPMAKVDPFLYPSTFQIGRAAGISLHGNPSSLASPSADLRAPTSSHGEDGAYVSSAELSSETGALPKVARRREEISRQVRDVEDILAELRRGGLREARSNRLLCICRAGSRLGVSFPGTFHDSLVYPLVRDRCLWTLDRRTPRTHRHRPPHRLQEVGERVAASTLADRCDLPSAHRRHLPLESRLTLARYPTPRLVLARRLALAPSRSVLPARLLRSCVVHSPRQWLFHPPSLDANKPASCRCPPWSRFLVPGWPDSPVR